MPPSRIIKSRFSWAETPKLQELKTLNFVLAPPNELLAPRTESSQALQAFEALQDQPSPAIDVRLFGPRPILEMENSVDRVLQETALVRAKPAEKSLLPVKERNWQFTLPHPIKWIKNHKLATALASIGSIGLGIWGTFLYFFPIQTLLVAAIEVALVTGIIFSYKGIAWARDTASQLIRSTLVRLMGISHALPKPKSPLELPPGSEGGEGPYRSPAANSETARVEKLIGQVLKPTRGYSRYSKNSERIKAIHLLGESLKAMSPQQPEFRQGLEALRQILEKSPVVRYSSRFWKLGRKEINMAALETLVAILDHHPELTERKDLQLIPVAETALAILSNRGMLEYIYRKSHSNREEALYKSVKLMFTLAKMLRTDHPQSIYCSAAMTDFFSSTESD